MNTKAGQWLSRMIRIVDHTGRPVTGISGLMQVIVHSIDVRDGFVSIVCITVLIGSVPLCSQKIITNRFKSNLILRNENRVAPVVVKRCHKIFDWHLCLIRTTAVQSINHIKQRILSQVTASHQINQHTIFAVTVVCWTAQRYRRYQRMMKMKGGVSGMRSKMILGGKRHPRASVRLQIGHINHVISLFNNIIQFIGIGFIGIKNEIFCRRFDHGPPKI